MQKPKILSEEEIQERLRKLSGWSFSNDKISKQFQFDGFMEAIEFINQLAPYCEKFDHHPDIHIFYNKILFELQRFDVGGKVTEKDFDVAHEIERLYKLVGKKNE